MMKTRKTILLASLLALTLTLVSCGEEEVPLSRYNFVRLLGNWQFTDAETPVMHNEVIWIGPYFEATVKGMPMLWNYVGDVFTAQGEVGDTVYRLQFKVLSLTDTTMFVDGAYGYVVGVNGTDWSTGSFAGHSWPLEAKDTVWRR